MNLRTFLSRWYGQPATWRTQRVLGGRLRRRSIFAVGVLVAFACAVAISGAASALAAPSAAATPATSSSDPNFGPNVYIFNPSMPQSEIQPTVNAVANQQLSNQFGTQRYALLFEPGTYGSST